MTEEEMSVPGFKQRQGAGRNYSLSSVTGEHSGQCSKIWVQLSASQSTTRHPWQGTATSTEATRRLFIFTFKNF